MENTMSYILAIKGNMIKYAQLAMAQVIRAFYIFQAGETIDHLAQAQHMDLYEYFCYLIHLLGDGIIHYINFYGWFQLVVVAMIEALVVYAIIKTVKKTSDKLHACAGYINREWLKESIPPTLPNKLFTAYAVYDIVTSIIGVME
jgi:hypothetical protein